MKMIARICSWLMAMCWSGVTLAAPEKRILDGVTYQVITTAPGKVRIVWADENGKALRTFPEVARYYERNGVAIDALMNGGIFEPGCVPSGLLVQDGRMLRPVNRNAGKGNFYLKPNGIFLIGAKGAAVVRTEDYPMKDVAIHYAVQSGPLLLHQGRTHPSFNASSASRLHRNGVGVTKKGDVVLAMTDIHSPRFPNLHEFARLFGILGCEDALFLDGDISQLQTGDGVSRPSNHFGAIIAVTENGVSKDPTERK
jgi:uncharacterized protein YigE (DUF2233 family)